MAIIKKETIGNKIKYTVFGFIKISWHTNNKKQPDFIPPKTFQNEARKKLKANYNNYLSVCKIINNEADNMKSIARISFELSNICNYSYLHKKCATHCYKEKIILPSEVVYKAIDELSEYSFEGVVAFHRYNEPLIDPRLFQFIEYTNRKLPNAKILILTNGFYLNQQMLDELSKYNIWSIEVSSYSLKEHERLIQLKTHIPYEVFFSILDNRESIYECEEKNISAPCYAPLNDLTINSYGEVNLCCLDWLNKFNYGNLKDKGLKEIVNSQKFNQDYINLKNGKRDLEICKRCDWRR